MDQGTVTRKIKNKLRAIEYCGGKCEMCGRTGPYYIYDFHHKDGVKKEVQMNRVFLRRWEKILHEIKKCRLLCAVCHRVEHYSNHQKGA